MKKAIAEFKRLRSILSGITGLEDDDQEYIEDARKSVDRIIEALAEQPEQQQERCHLCDCTGEIHSPDGEWRGECPHCNPPQRKPLTDEQIDRAIAELGLNYFADAANNRAVLRELCRKAAYGVTGETQ